MKCFKGLRRKGRKPTIFVDCGDSGYHLQPYCQVWQWGDGSMDWAGNNGQRWQLALGILMDLSCSQGLAMSLFNDLANRVFRKFHPDAFLLDELSLYAWCAHTLVEQRDEAICGSPYRLLEWSSHEN